MVLNHGLLCADVDAVQNPTESRQVPGPRVSLSLFYWVYFSSWHGQGVC